MRNQQHGRLIAPAPGSTRQQQTPDDGASPAKQPRPRVVPPRERARRPQVTNVACTPCRRRKTKCCGRRPVCVSCEEKQSECNYVIEEDQTRQGSLKRSNDALRGELDAYKHVMTMLQTAAGSEVSEILQRIRSTDDISETVQLIQASSLLLQQDHVQSRTSLLGSSQQSPVSAPTHPPPLYTNDKRTGSKNPMELHNMMQNEGADASSLGTPNKKQHTTKEYELQQQQQQFYVDRSSLSSSATVAS